MCGAGVEAAISHRAPCRTARCTALCTASHAPQWWSRCSRCPRCHGATRPLSITHAPLSTTLGGGPGQRVRHADTRCSGGRRLYTGQPATAKLLPHTLLAWSTCMASLVAGYRPVHLTKEPLHTPRLPLRRRSAHSHSPCSAMLPSCHPFRSGSPHSCSPCHGLRPKTARSRARSFEAPRDSKTLVTVTGKPGGNGKVESDRPNGAPPLTVVPMPSPLHAHPI